MNAALVLLALSVAHGDVRAIVDAGTARTAITAAPVAAVAGRMQQQAADGDADTLVATIRAALTDPALAPVAREWLVEAGLAALWRLPATPSARALARELSSRPPRVYTRVEPEDGRSVVPLYDPAAAARFALRAWTRRDAHAAAAQALRTASPQALDAYPAATDVDSAAIRDGIVDAFAEADATALLGLRAAAIGAMRDGQDIDRPALAMARRLRDPELYSLVIDHAAPAAALAAVQTAVQDLDAAALPVLSRAADRAPVASAALLSIGRLADRDATARQLLLDRLSDPVSGDSAAAAIARIDDPSLAARLGARMRQSGDEATRRRIALALKLNDGAAARQELARLARGKQGSTELRKEVAAWLARTR